MKGAVACMWGNGTSLEGGKRKKQVKMLFIDLLRHHAILNEARCQQM